MAKEPGLLRYALPAIIALAFAVRMLPVLLYQVPVGLDSYLHIDIAMRIATGGEISLDPMSLLGLKAYSYPPGFHLILAAFVTLLPPVLGSHAFGALIGAMTVLLVYLLSQEVFSDKRVSLFAALFFSLSPTHIFRTSMPIPEGFGVLLFSAALLMLVKYLKEKKVAYLAAVVGILAVYVFSHRGWSLFILSGAILLLVWKHDIFRKKRYVISAVALVAAGYYALTAYFSDLIARINIEAVTALGYFKWMGVVQLALGACGAILLYKSNDRLRLFMVVWAALLLLVGSFSFRFRDPYAAIPLSLLAGYALQNFVLPQAKKKKKELVLLSLLLLVAFSQATWTALFVVEHPSPGEMEALIWIRENTPEDSMILTWKEEGYYIMGVTERKDILTWKKVYEGFFDEAPSVDEAKAAYTDMFVMFRSSQKERMLSLMEAYSVDYIYIDARMRSQLDALQYGLVEYLSYDTHFRPVFANDGTEIYEFIPQRMEPSGTATLEGNGDYSIVPGEGRTISLITYLEGYWNGIAYIDKRDYRAHYPDNAMIAGMLLSLNKTAGNEAYGERAQWLLSWLSFEQLPDGAFFDQKYEDPKKSTQATCLVVSEIADVAAEYPGLEVPSLSKARSYILSQYGSYLLTLESSVGEDYRTDADCLVAARKLGESGMEANLLESLLSAQREDGSWPYGTFSSRATVNSQASILYSLSEYYGMTGDSRVFSAIERGTLFLSRNRNGQGAFWNYVTETGRVIKTDLSSYPKAVKAYGAAGKIAEREKTIAYLSEKYDPAGADLEALVYVMDGLQ